MNITQNQGLQYKKLIEGFSSKIGAPKTFDVNNEDLINLENLKKQFDSAVSDYSSLRKIISDNARNYVTLKTKSNQEYKDYIDRNIQLTDGSKYYVTNSGVAKKYSNEAWNSRHSSCKKISDDPRPVSIANEAGLKTNQPSILLGTAMKVGEPCGKGYQNIKVNIPMHDDPKMVGCFYNSSAAKEARNLVVKDETALNPDSGESIIGTGKTFEECRIEALKRLKNFFSLTAVDDNNKGTCIVSNDTDKNLKYGRHGSTIPLFDTTKGKFYSWSTVKDNVLRITGDISAEDCRQQCYDDDQCTAWEKCDGAGGGCPNCYLFKGITSEPVNSKSTNYAELITRNGRTCNAKDSQGYYIGKPQKCKTVPDVCQPRKYEQIKDFYDCDVTDSIGNPTGFSHNKTRRQVSSLLPEKYYLKTTIKSTNGRWAASGQLKHVMVAYDDLAEKFSKEIEFRGYVPKNNTFTKTVEVPFELENTELYGVSIYIGRDMLQADWVKLEVSFDNQSWVTIGGDGDGKFWDSSFSTRYNDYFTIRTDKEFSLNSILNRNSRDNINEGRMNTNYPMWKPINNNSNEWYSMHITGGDALIHGLEIQGNISKFNLYYKNSAENSGWIDYMGNSGTKVKDLYPEYGSNGKVTVYFDYPIPANVIMITNFTTSDGKRPSLRANPVGDTSNDGLQSRDNIVKFEGYYSAIGAQAAALGTNLGEKTFEECIIQAAKLNVRYFGIFDYNKKTQKVKCFFPSNNQANSSANDFYMAGYENRWKKLESPKKYSGNVGYELGADNQNIAIYTTDAKCKDRPKDGKPIDCPSGTKYYSTAQGMTDQCCTERDDCDAGFSTIYSSEITDASTFGNEGYVDRNNILHPYANMKIDETDSSCPKTEVASVTGELWSKFNMGTNMTKEKTCGIAQLSKEEKNTLKAAENNLRDIAENIDNKIESAYKKNLELNETNVKNKSEFKKRFDEYKKQYKKVKSEYSTKIQTMYEDLELKHSGDFVQIAGIVALTGLVIGGGIYYMRKSKATPGQSST